MLQSQVKGVVAAGGLECYIVDIRDLMEDPARLDVELLRYQLASMHMCEASGHFSWATDDSQCNTVSLNNGMLALPSGLATVLAPQVVSDACKTKI